MAPVKIFNKGSFSKIMFLSAARRSLISALSCSSKRIFLNSIKRNTIKSFSSTATSTLKRSNSNPTKELIKTLETELADQAESIKDEEISPSNVLDSFSEFIGRGNWKIEHSPDNLMVSLKRRDEKLAADITVKFDLLQVYNNVSEVSQSEIYDQDEPQMSSTTESESFGELDDYDVVSLPISVEIIRDSVSEKKLNFECILEGDEEESSLVIENISIEPINSSPSHPSTIYTSPNFAQLDETLQENFKEFLVNMMGGNSEELLSFIQEYSVAHEALMYQKWLGEVRDVLKH